MTHATTTNLFAMPPAEDIAVEAVQRLVADGYVSSVMRLPRSTLNELARRLVSPGESVKDAAIDYLISEDYDLPKTNVYRFADRFREVYCQVWGTWANRLIVAQIAKDPDITNKDVQRVIKQRVMTLIAQEVMTTDPAALDTARLNTALSAVIAADKTQIELAKLDIARHQADQKSDKLAAEITRLNQEISLKQKRVEERLTAAQKRIEELEDRAQRGQAIDPDIFASLRNQLAGITQETVDTGASS